jgi:hypothetical protein
MIAKKSTRKKGGQSSFSGLAKYITREASNGELVEYMRISNCGFDSFDLALKEIEATQSRNTRAKSDKTYHLIISFPSGEKPIKEQLEDIEDEMCKAIGLGEHQRISALHTDTDNVHLHVAINKIHPLSHRIVDVLKDHYRLDEACSMLEQKHGLQRDNRIDRSRGNEGVLARSDGKDFEANTGQISFKRWISKRLKNIQSSIDSASSWADLHERLARFDVTIKPRGSGLVLSARSENAQVKASSLGKEYGKKALEDRMGLYEPPSENVTKMKPIESYRQQIQASQNKQVDLWARYQFEYHQAIAEKKKLITELYDARKSALNPINHEFVRNKQAIKADPLLSKAAKRNAYKKLFEHKKTSNYQIHQLFKSKIQEVHRKFPLKNWQDWLLNEASKGNNEALKALRNSILKSKKGSETNRFSGDSKHSVFTSIDRNVRKNGDVIYQFNKTAVRDTGDELKLNGADEEGLEKAIRMARNKFGDHLKVDGNEAFKLDVLKVVIETGQKVTFDDPELESKRKILTEIQVEKEGLHKEKKTKTAIHMSDTAIQKWIDSQSKTRVGTYDILEVRRFGKSDQGNVIYSGIRQIDDDTKVVLYHIDGAVLVEPVTGKQAVLFQKMKVGEELQLNSSGQPIFRFKDRSHGR